MLRKLITIFTLLLFAAGCLLGTACTQTAEALQTVLPEASQFNFPATVDVERQGLCTFTMQPGAVQQGDILYLESKGQINSCTLTAITESSFTLQLPASLSSGTYDVRLKRGQLNSKIIGKLTINIVDRIVRPDAGTTIYGTVMSAEGPVVGVQVSDGVNIVLTDRDGVYQLKSDKSGGFVFITVPSGFEPLTDGVFPVNYRALTMPANVPENASFTLRKVNQGDCRLLMLGDMHLANRAKGGTASNADNTQFKTAANDINDYVRTAGKPVYALTLGDMTWDLYWYDCAFGPADYRRYLNSQLSGLIVYNTIGNHDNDMNASGQRLAKAPYVNAVAPPYYAFNIGAVHCVVLDNVDCERYVGGGDKNRDNARDGLVYDPQLEWLAKDLQYVDRSTRIIVAMHVPLFNDTAPESAKLREYSQRVIDAFKGYDVQFMTGHTHRNYNVMPGDTGNGTGITERNVGAVCGDWWWSGAKTPGTLLSPDGTPAGYGIWELNGLTMNYLYKSIGKDASHQFRSYDLNRISYSAADVEGGVPTNTALRREFERMIADYTGVRDNRVLINVWNWNRNWRISVRTADGRELPVSKVSAYDPLHISANVFKRWTSAATSAPIGSTSYSHHFFKVTAPDADTDLDITVTDDHGRTYTQRLSR